MFKFKFECVCFSFGKKMESFSLSLSWFPAHPAHPSISLFSFFFLPPAAHGAPSAHSPLQVQSASPPSLPLSPTGGPCLSGPSSSSRPTGTRAEPESDRVSPRRGLRGAHAKDSPLTPIKGSARSPKPHEPVADALAPAGNPNRRRYWSSGARSRRR